MEFECPNCGEPIDEDAPACPHCGSDDETGWSPDVDYFSVELPEDDDDFDDLDASLEPAYVTWPGHALLTLALIVFMISGFAAYAWGVLLPLAFLAVCALLFTVGTHESIR